MTIEICDLGVWARSRLLAEYDAETDAVRISAHAVERVRARLGAAAAAEFVACAVAHERHHREHPRAGEAQARMAGAAACTLDPRCFEAVLR